MSQIVDMTAMQNYLDVSVNETKLQVIVAGVNAALLRTMHRPSLRVSGQQYLHAKSLTAKLRLNWPLISIEEVREDWEGYFGQPANRFEDDSELVLGTDFIYDPSEPKPHLIRIDGQHWATSPGSIRVNYVWGWASPPADMMQAGMRLAALAWDQRFREGGVQSERFGQYAYELLSGGSTGDADHDSDLISIRRTIASYALEVL